jgi:hypothetical protein
MLKFGRRETSVLVWGAPRIDALTHWPEECVCKM